MKFVFLDYCVADVWLLYTLFLVTGSPILGSNSVYISKTHDNLLFFMFWLMIEENFRNKLFKRFNFEHNQV